MGQLGDVGLIQDGLRGRRHSCQLRLDGQGGEFSQEPGRKQKVIVLRATFFTFVPLPQERRLEWVGMLGEGGDRRLKTYPQILLWLGEL